jgi:hypothetical protein
MGFPYTARRMSGCGGWWRYSFAGSLWAKQIAALTGRASEFAEVNALVQVLAG